MGQIKYTTCPLTPHKDQFKTKKEAARRYQQIVRKSKAHGTPKPDTWYDCPGCGFFHLGTRPKKKSKTTRQELVAAGIIQPH